MRKRGLIPFLMLMMVLFVCPVRGGDASAESVLDAVYAVLLRTDAGDVPLGSGVLYGGQDTLLTAESCVREGALYVTGADGEHAVTSWESCGAGLALVKLDPPAQAQPLTLDLESTSVIPAVIGINAQGERVTVPLSQLRYDRYGMYDALQLHSTSGVMPGGVLVNANGQVTVMIVDRQAEGDGLYTGLAADVLQGVLTGEAGKALPLEFSWTGGLMTVQWADAPRTDGVYVLRIMAEENSYYRTIEFPHDQTQAELIVPPGHAYCIQVQWAASSAEVKALLMSEMTRYAVPDRPFTAMDFSQECYLASAPDGMDEISILQEADFVSVDTLTAEGISPYMQIICTYAQTEETLEVPMTVSLTAPDGQLYYETMGFYFEPEYAAQDAFTVPLGDLFASCAKFSGQGTLPAGAYEIAWSIAGQSAGAYAFTVAEAGAAGPEAGAVQGILLSEKDGAVTVDWSHCVIPEGKKVTVCVYYAGNAHFIYLQPLDAATEATFVRIPGKAGMVWAVYSDGRIDNAGEMLSSVVLLSDGAPAPIDLYGMRNLRCSVTVTADAQAAERGEYLPVTPITREALMGGAHLIFQTEDAYTVTEESAGHALAIVLTTPEGMCFLTDGGYTFSPEMGASDLWVLDITDMAEEYAASVGELAWPQGEYTIGYYIDGQTVAEFAFTVE